MLDQHEPFTKLGGGNSNIFGIFTPKIWELIPILTNIFEMGWNHQLDDGVEFLSSTCSCLMFLLGGHAIPLALQALIH